MRRRVKVISVLAIFTLYTGLATAGPTINQCNDGGTGLFENGVAKYSTGDVTSGDNVSDYELSTADVSSCTTMESMFEGASSFNQNLSSWDTGQVTDMSDMFNGTSLGVSNYDSILCGWNNTQGLNSGLNLDADSYHSFVGLECKKGLTDESGPDWTINDKGIIEDLGVKRKNGTHMYLRANISDASKPNLKAYFEYKYPGGNWKETTHENIDTKGMFNQTVNVATSLSYRAVLKWDNGNNTDEKVSGFVSKWEGGKKDQYIPTKPVASEDSVVFSGYQSTFARDVSSGALLWENDTIESTYLSGMKVNDGSLYITSPTGIYSLEVKTGSEKWSRNDLNGKNMQLEYSDGKIFVGNHSDNHFRALNATTGETLWSYSSSFDRVAEESGPDASDGIVVTGLKNGGDSLVALNASTGDKLWGKSFGTTYSSPVISEGKVFAGNSVSSPYFRVYNLSTGDSLWTATAEYHYTQPEVYNGTVYVATCGNSIFAYDTETGDKKWDKTSFGCSYDVSDPVISDGLLYTSVYSATHKVLDPETGDTVFSYDNPSGDKYTSPGVLKRENQANTLFLADRYSSGNTLAFERLDAVSLNLDWSDYSSSTNANGYRIYHGITGIDESNMIEVGSSVESKHISDSSWNPADQVCVEIRPFNSNGEASSEEQCLTLE